MKERPILFSGTMVRAILAGRKTQTRRVVRADRYGPWVPHLDEAYADPGLGDGGYLHVPYTLGGERVSHRVRCQHAIGDRLWVRETFAPRYFDDGRPGYRADWNGLALELCDEPRWKPSIFMRRAESRITLEVTAVRVERLQDITEEDARAEGVTPFPADPGGDCWTDGKHRTAFEYTWNEIHGWHPSAWASNPWVWVVSFRRLVP